MKRWLIFLVCFCLFFFSCQKEVVDNGTGNNNGTGSEPNIDSLIVPGDKVMYEVITKDSLGWFGAWNDSTGNLVTGKLDSVNYGSPILFPNGWTYSFTCPNKPFQALISVDAAQFTDDITVNLYKNGKLIKSSTNNPYIGFTKLISTAQTDSLVGTPQSPVVTYEVLVSEPDTSKFESDSWLGVWTEMNGLASDNLVDDSGNQYINSMLFLFGMPSGWRRSFIPEHLPFDMRMFATPFSEGGGMLTVNFYVNGQLIKSGSSSDNDVNHNFIMEYTVH